MNILKNPKVYIHKDNFYGSNDIRTNKYINEINYIINEISKLFSNIDISKVTDISIHFALAKKKIDKNECHIILTKKRMDYDYMMTLTGSTTPEEEYLGKIKWGIDINLTRQLLIYFESFNILEQNNQPSIKKNIENNIDIVRKIVKLNYKETVFKYSNLFSTWQDVLSDVLFPVCEVNRRKLLNEIIKKKIENHTNYILHYVSQLPNELIFLIFSFLPKKYNYYYTLHQLCPRNDSIQSIPRRRVLTLKK